MAESTDGGLNWSHEWYDSTRGQDNHNCQGSIHRFTRKDEGYAKNRILVSYPDGNRTDLKVRMSYDENGSWPVSKIVYYGGAAYSDLTILPDGTIGILFEADGYSRIKFLHFNLEWLTDSTDYLDETGDLTADSEINLEDFCRIGKNWCKTGMR